MCLTFPAESLKHTHTHTQTDTGGMEEIILPILATSTQSFSFRMY